MIMLPAKLKKAGYTTHIVEMWYEGFLSVSIDDTVQLYHLWRKYLLISHEFDTSKFLSEMEEQLT